MVETWIGVALIAAFVFLISSVFLLKSIALWYVTRCPLAPRVGHWCLVFMIASGFVMLGSAIAAAILNRTG